MWKLDYGYVAQDLSVGRWAIILHPGAAIEFRPPDHRALSRSCLPKDDRRTSGLMAAFAIHGSRPVRDGPVVSCAGY